MQENALRRLGGDTMGALGPLPGRLNGLGVGRPRIAFSEVLALDLNGDSVHIVHQKPGYSDADALAHFHVANVFYLGEAFPVTATHESTRRKAAHFKVCSTN
jgi:hypothetical protein